MTKPTKGQNGEDLTGKVSLTQNLTSEAQMAQSDKISVDSKEGSSGFKLLGKSLGGECECFTQVRGLDWKGVTRCARGKG